MKSILPDDSYLTRFLFDIENEIPPKLEDLKAIADALIAMNDHGASFKKAFGTSAPSGRKPSKTKHLPRIESFQSMSEGWLGQRPFWLNRFLSKVNQEHIPEMNDLKCMAQALTELKKGESLVAAFGMRKKTSSKKLMEDFNLGRFYKSHELEIYLLYREKIGKTERYEEMPYDDEALHKVHEINGYSDRHIWRMVKTVSEYYYLLDSAKRNQEESWEIYDSYCCYLKKNTDVQKAIVDLQCDFKSKKPCLVLASLYEEVLKNQKYALIMTGKRQYPLDLKRQVKANLEPISQMIKTAEQIPKNTQMAIRSLYATTISKNISSSEAINSISYQLNIEPWLIKFYLTIF